MSTQSFPESPYKGLVPYAEEDAEFFFGRESENNIITANLMASRLTVLYGPSGVGKSSVLRAGVAHDLNILTRQNLKIYKTPEFAVVVFRAWRDNPIEGLLAHVQTAVERALNVEHLEPTRSSSLTETLNEWTRLLRQGDQEEVGELFIILDQFEEYFLYHPNEDGEGSFATEFPIAVNDPHLRVNFLISIREDWLAKLDYFKGRIPKLFDNYLRIEPLNRNTAHEAIERPLEHYNKLLGEKEPDVSIQPALVTEVIDQLEELAARVGLTEGGRVTVSPEPGAVSGKARIQTSYLQLVMTRLWEEDSRRWMETNGDGPRELKLVTLERLGNANNILQSHLENVMKNLTPDEQRLAARAFPHLVTAFGTKIASPASGLARLARVDEHQLIKVLDKLSDKSNSILTQVASPPNQVAGSWYEVYHDMLAPAILEWQMQYTAAQERIETENELAIERAAKVREQKRANNFRIVMFAAILLLVAMTCVTVYAFKLRDRAETAQAEANEQRGKAYDAAKEARDAAIEARFQKGNAETALGMAETAKADLLEQKNKAEEQTRIAQASEQKAIEAKEAEVAAQRNFKDATLKSVALGEADMFTRSALDETRAGKIPNAINLYEKARQKYQELENYPGETSALVNIAESYANLGAVVPGDVIQLILSKENDDAMAQVNASSLAILYTSLAEERSGNQKETDKAKALAIESYRKAIGVNKQNPQDDKELKEAGMLRRIGDIYISSIITTESDTDPDTTKAVESYEEARTAFAHAGAHNEEGLLLIRLATLADTSDSKKIVGGKPVEIPKDIAAREAQEKLKKMTNYFEMARTAFQQSHNQAQEAFVLTSLSELYGKSSEQDSDLKAKAISKAISYAKDAAPLYKSAGKPEKEAEVYVTIAKFYSELKENQNAVTNYKLAFDIYHKIAAGEKNASDEPGTLSNDELQMLRNIGSLLKEGPESKQELKDYYDSVAASYSNDPSARARVLNSIAGIYNADLKDEESAAAYYEQAERLWLEKGNYLEAGNTLYQYGLLYNDLEDRQKAIGVFNKARAAYAQVGALAVDDKGTPLRLSITNKLLAMGKTYAAQGDKQSALKTYDEAFLVYRENPPDKLASAYSIDEIVQAAVNVYTELKDEHGVDEQGVTAIFQQALDFYQKINKPTQMASTLNAFGEFYNKMGEKEKALEKFKQALSIYQTANTEYVMAQLVQSIGKIYLGRQQGREAEEFFRETLEWSRKGTNHSSEAYMLGTIGALYEDAGNTQEAIKYYELQRSAWKQIKYTYQEADSLKKLSALYTKAGRPEDAAKATQEAAALSNRR